MHHLRPARLLRPAVWFRQRCVLTVVRRHHLRKLLCGLPASITASTDIASSTADIASIAAVSSVTAPVPAATAATIASTATAPVAASTVVQ